MDYVFLFEYSISPSIPSTVTCYVMLISYFMILVRQTTGTEDYTDLKRKKCRTFLTVNAILRPCPEADINHQKDTHFLMENKKIALF